ncbi:MAG: GNAT family N-acetyltransferase [Deltaproteobacteria bacterium]|nr:GNAT family N-acetyltransferase [Deltaproteobacteria bacterium]
MAHEVEDAGGRRRLVEALAMAQVELLDTAERLPPESLSVFVDDPADPSGLLTIAWGAGPLGFSNEASLTAARITSLEELLGCLPRGHGTYRLTVPFWAAPAVSSLFKCELSGPVARYALLQGEPAPHPAAGQTEPLAPDDLDIVAFAFPRAVPEAPHRALILKDELVAVAITTHLAGGVARIGVHVGEEHRGRGFGGGVARALIADLRARDLAVTAEVALASEPAVRMAEGLGLSIIDARLAFHLAGQHPA